MCIIKIFIGGAGMVHGEGVTAKDAWNGVAGVGGHKKFFVGGGGTEGTTTPAPPPLKF